MKFPQTCVRIIFSALFFLQAGCSSVFFYPSKALFSTPDKFGVAFKEVTFDSLDGTKLTGWWLPAEGEEKGTILFLHGNAENISSHYHIVQWLPKRGYTIFLFDYRGYGASEGSVGVAGSLDDIRASMGFLRASGKKSFHVYGQSLGGSLLIAALEGKALPAEILSVTMEGSFSSFRSVARDTLASIWLTWPFQFLPWLLLPATSMTELLPPEPHVPFLFIHGANDRIVPCYHSERLFEAAPPPKNLWIVPKGEHGDTFRRDSYRECFIRFLEGAPSNNCHALGNQASSESCFESGNSTP